MWARRRGRSIPTAGCDDRANATHSQKTRRLEGGWANGRLASLLLSRRSTREWASPALRVRFPKGRCAPVRIAVSFGAPRQPAIFPTTAPRVVFNQALKGGSATAWRLCSPKPNAPLRLRVVWIADQIHGCWFSVFSFASAAAISVQDGARHAPASPKSHKRTVWSTLPEASSRSSGVKASPVKSAW